MLIFDDKTDGSRSQQPHSLTQWSVGILPRNKIIIYFLKVCLEWGNFYGFWGKHDLLSSLVKEADGITAIDMTQTETELLQGLQLTFPIDNSFSGCYKGRQSCLDRDLPSEVDISESPTSYWLISLRLISLWATFSPLEAWWLTGLDFLKQSEILSRRQNTRYLCHSPVSRYPEK